MALLAVCSANLLSFDFTMPLHIATTAQKALIIIIDNVTVSWCCHRYFWLIKTPPPLTVRVALYCNSVT